MRLRKDPLADELAALDELEDEIRRPRPKRGSIVLPILTMMIVAAGGSTIAWYSYTAGLKEGSESAAPLLKPDGPMKVVPDKPGGRVIPHREKTAFNMIDGRQSDRRVERLLPPPELPRNPPVAPVAPVAKAPAAGSDSRVRAADSVPAESIYPREATGAPVRLAPRYPGRAEPPVTALPPPAPPPPARKAMPEIDLTPTPRRTRPVARTPAPRPKTKRRPAVATRVTGAGYRIQIGALASDAQARRLWAQATGKHEDLLGNLSLNVEQATVKGKTYFRVQAGPLSDRASARTLCAKLKRRETGCIVVKPRG